MTIIEVVFNVKLPITIKKKAKVFISSCPPLDVTTQGQTEAEAKKNLKEAVKVFLITCFETDKQAEFRHRH